MYLIDDALAVLEPAYAELSPELPDDPSVLAMTAQLARAYQLHEEPLRAIEWADRALVAAERLYLLPVIADAITTKGSSMALVGRVWEGLGLVRAGRELAEANGLMATSLRATISLTGALNIYDPRAARELGREGFDLARRLGLRHLAVITASECRRVGPPDRRLGMGDPGPQRGGIRRTRGHRSCRDRGGADRDPGGPRR